jgi:hypothetical protein
MWERRFAGMQRIQGINIGGMEKYTNQESLFTNPG